jgi:ABC-2 type transport system ATP-binding protein
VAVVAVNGLTKRFGARTAVDGVSLVLERGEIMGFLGPNGSGKTTTIRMICGLLTPDAGEGTVLDYDVVTQSQAIKRRVGYMTQRFSYYEDLTVAENLSFVARLYELAPVRDHVDRTIAGLGLEARRDQLAGTLSGGWKQRLALAAAIMHAPDLLLLDEPTAGVDPKARRDFWDELHRLAARGLTVLVSTHYMDEAERCHRVSYISQGKLLLTGTTAEVIAQSKLIMFILEGSGLADVARRLEQVPGVYQVASFGAALHVVGRDLSSLQSALEPYAHDPAMRVNRGETSLEDVLIELMRNGPGGSES